MKGDPGNQQRRAKLITRLRECVKSNELCQEAKKRSANDFNIFKKFDTLARRCEKLMQFVASVDEFARLTHCRIDEVVVIVTVFVESRDLPDLEDIQNPWDLYSADLPKTEQFRQLEQL
jgi:hypothetical protein